jgi:hypothetical protein
MSNAVHASDHEIQDDDHPRLRAVVLDGRGAPSPSQGRWMCCDTSSGTWLIDLRESRLCRSDQVRDPQFIAPEHWLDFEVVWVGSDQVRAELVDGKILSARRVA